MKHNWTITIDIKSQPFFITPPKKGSSLMMTEGDAGWVNTGVGEGGGVAYYVTL